MYSIKNLGFIALTLIALSSGNSVQAAPAACQSTTTEAAYAMVQPIPETIVSMADPLSKPVPLPSFKLKSYSGKEITEKNYKGKTLLIDVWASWCGPCRQEIPHIISLRKEMAAKNIPFAVLGVSKDRTDADHKAAVKQLGIPYSSCMYTSDGGKFLTDLQRAMGQQIRGIPFLVLVNAKGQIVAAECGCLDLNSLRNWVETNMKK